MKAFTIRVELHAAQSQHYAMLAADLAPKGIVDVIQAGDGVWYKMPPAEYNFVGNQTLQQVYEATVASAKKTGRSYAVLVTEATSRTWIGLEPVQAMRSA